jgi:hypothetical protein
MRIENLKHMSTPPSADGFKCICRFTLEFTSELKLYDLQLVQSPNGKLDIYPPVSKNGSRVSSFAPSLRQRIAELVVNALVADLANQARGLLEPRHRSKQKAVGGTRSPNSNGSGAKRPGA